MGDRLALAAGPHPVAEVKVMGTPCKHPEKVLYRSERAAKTALHAVVNNGRGGGGFLHVYRCGGHWHIGHGSKSWRRTPGRKFR